MSDNTATNGVEQPAISARTTIEWRDPRTLKVHPLNERHVPRSPEAKRREFIAQVAADGEIKHALDILPDGSVLCGRERLEAALAVALSLVPVRVRSDLAADADEQLLLVVRDNFDRKDFTPLQKVAQLKAIEPILKRRAAARQALTQFGSSENGGGGKSATTAGKVREQMAVLAGMSARSWDKASRLYEESAAGRAPIVVLYEQENLSLDAAHRALDLPVAEQTEIREEVVAAPEDARARLALERVDDALKRAEAATGLADEEGSVESLDEDDDDATPESEEGEPMSVRQNTAQRRSRATLRRASGGVERLDEAESVGVEEHGKKLAEYAEGLLAWLDEKRGDLESLSEAPERLPAPVRARLRASLPSLARRFWALGVALGAEAGKLGEGDAADADAGEHLCPSCGEPYEDDPPPLRECSKDACGAQFVSDERNCQECNNPFTRKLAEHACESCQEPIDLDADESGLAG